jgi:hypothetical protein
MVLGVVMTVLTLLFAVAYEETKFIRPVDYDRDNIESLQMGGRDKEAASERHAQASFPHYLRLQLLTPTSEPLWRTFYQPIFSMAMPEVLFTALVYSFDVCVINIKGSMTSIIFVEPPYNFSSRELGLMQLGPFIGTIFGTLYGGYLVDKAILWLARRNGDVFEAEMRLYFMPIPALAMAAGVIVFGITANQVRLVTGHVLYPGNSNRLVSRACIGSTLALGALLLPLDLGRLLI